MLVGFFCVGVVISGEMSQFQARQILYRDVGQRTTFQHARQETFHVRADPVQQIHRLHFPYVGRAQGIVMGRGAGRQQDFRNCYAVLHRRGNQLQGFDAGEDFDLGLS